MRKYISILLLPCLFCSCKSVSKFTIDEKAKYKIDSGLLGTWKAVEDTDKRNFILIQDNYDVHRGLEEYEYGTLKVYDNDYYITYFNMHGKNPRYQQFSAFLSVINEVQFLNITYNYAPWSAEKNNFTGPTETGFFFVRFNINATYDTLTTAVVSDTTLGNLTSSKEVRNRIRTNINDPHFYSDTLHFYKKNGYHLSLQEAVKNANQQ